MSDLAKKLTMELTWEERDLIVARRSEQSKFKPRSLESYSVEEKNKFFDEMYARASSALKQKETEKYLDDDFEHYIYEDVMDLLTPEGEKRDVFWNYYGKL